jgi:hypothetical protein
MFSSLSNAWADVSTSLASSAANANANANANAKVKDNCAAAVVFVHGFLGSKDSFHSFPTELQNTLKDNSYNVTILTYDYETAGTNGSLSLSLSSLSLFPSSLLSLSLSLLSSLSLFSLFLSISLSHSLCFRFPIL